MENTQQLPLPSAIEEFEKMKKEHNNKQQDDLNTRHVFIKILTIEEKLHIPNTTITCNHPHSFL